MTKESYICDGVYPNKEKKKQCILEISVLKWGTSFHSLWTQILPRLASPQYRYKLDQHYH